MIFVCLASDMSKEEHPDISKEEHKEMSQEAKGA